jgi:hypothetical protein
MGMFTSRAGTQAGRVAMPRIRSHQLLAAGGLSLLTHLLVIVALATGTPTPIEALRDGAMTVVPVVEAPMQPDTTPATAAAAPTPPPPATADERLRPPRTADAPAPPRTALASTSAPTPARRRRPAVAPAAVDPAPTAEDAAGNDLPQSPPARALHEPAADAHAVPATSAARPRMMPVALGPARAPGATAPRPVYLDPGVAQGLRLEDSFPNLPEALRMPGARHVVMAEVCVARTGAVASARIAGEAASRPLGEALRHAILGWRYRPFLVDGAPTPFCHLLRIAYQFR